MNKTEFPKVQNLLDRGNLSSFFSADACMKSSYFPIALCLCLYGCSHSNAPSNPPGGGNFRIHISDSISEVRDNDSNTNFAILAAYWADSVNTIGYSPFPDSNRATIFCNDIKMHTENSAEYYILFSPLQRDTVVGRDSTLHFTNQFNHEIASVKLHNKPVISFHNGDTIPGHSSSTLTVFPQQLETPSLNSYIRVYVDLDRQGGIYSSAYLEQENLDPKSYTFRPDTLILNTVTGPHDLTVIIWYYDMLNAGFDTTAIKSLGAVQEVATHIKIYVK